MVRNLTGAFVLFVLLLASWRFYPRVMRKLELDGGGPQSALASAAPSDTRAQPQVPSGPPLRVLFIGNSHTFMHNMPQMIAELARAAGQKPFEFAMDTPGGSTLAEHLGWGRLPGHLASGRWDYVVLQDQQQRPAWRRNKEQLERELFGPARTMDTMIKGAGSRTLLYMTAARRDGDPGNIPGDTYAAMQERVRASYDELGAELHAGVVPAGVAWRWSRERRPELELFADDGYHPSRAGSYLIACSFYARIYARSPEDNGYLAELPEADARFLQRAAEVARQLQ